MLDTLTDPPAAQSEPAHLLAVENLTTAIRTATGTLYAVDEMSFTLDKGETLGIVGESGCGKSMSALSILRLLPRLARTVDGTVNFRGRDLLKLHPSAMRRVRGNEISMIFQEPMTSLNPVKTIGSQVSEVLTLHQGLTQRQAMARAIDMLQLVRIPEAAHRFHDYPHHFSGGMRQRVMIAMALACDPKVLLADEPTTALDVTIQAQIMELIAGLRDRLGTAVVLITHDLGLIAENADRVVVMYAGRKVEEASVQEIFSHPCHPYTQGLLRSVPRLGSTFSEGDQRARLREIPGTVPSLVNLPSGCSFAPRCPHATSLCREQRPPLEAKLPDHWAACWHADRVLEAEA
jgi:peptide/nickel transport system ATP-binding protein